MVPPPPIPLTFLAASAAGLVACGAALVWARTTGVADPTADPVVAAAHYGMLATLSTGVLGALHQFTPVVTQRPLRSARLAWATFLTWVLAAWLLPTGFATGHEWLVEAGGGLAAVAVTLLVANLSAPLAARGKGAPVTGLRFAVAGFVLTACFGIVYVADRSGAWFILVGHVVLAHAVIGLFAWLGLSYISVAQKLWPMFFLSHVPGKQRSGQVAVWAVPGGIVLLSPGLLFRLPWLASAGAAVLAVGLAAHMVQMRAFLVHRRRKADLHLYFVLTSATMLPCGAGLALAATLVMPRDHHLGMALAAATVVAIAGWLLESLVGHSHKVVPFIVWSALRSRGIATSRSGKPLGFGDLYNHQVATAVYALTTAGIAAVCTGFAASAPDAIAVGGTLLIVAGVSVAANLAITPALMLRSAAAKAGPAVPPIAPKALAAAAGAAAGTSGAADSAAAKARAAVPAAVAAARAGLAGDPPAGDPPAGDPPAGDPPAGDPPAGAAPAWDAGGPASSRHGGPGTLSVVAIAVSAVAVIMSAAALWPGQPAGSGTAASTAASAHVVANGRTKTFDISEGDLWVRPGSISVPYGTRVILHVVNRGGMSHDLQLEGGSTGTGMLAPGQSATVDYGVFGHSEQAWCTVPGHKAAGMILDIDVTGAPAVQATQPAMAAAGQAASSGSDAVINSGATPPKGWKPFSAALSPAPGGTVHRVTLIAEDKLMQVAPGVTQDMWTWNGQVPGPTLVGHVGDEFIVTLVNHTSMGHSLDFHAADEPMQDMATVAPGKSMTIRFRANYSGIFLYHCGTAPIIEHLADGMFGAVIIDPPHLDPVAHQFLLVQSELYLGPQGQSGDYAKMISDKPDATVFNEYDDQYLYSPLRVKAGQRIRIWVLDAGPNNDSAFHMVGIPFDTVWNNGAYLVQRGNPYDGAAQTLNLDPGEGGFVEFTVPAVGMYEFLDHHLDHAASGAAGYLIASAP